MIRLRRALRRLEAIEESFQTPQSASQTDEYTVSYDAKTNASLCAAFLMCRVLKLVKHGAIILGRPHKTTCIFLQCAATHSGGYYVFRHCGRPTLSTQMSKRTAHDEPQRQTNGEATHRTQESRRAATRHSAKRMIDDDDKGHV